MAQLQQHEFNDHALTELRRLRRIVDLLAKSQLDLGHVEVGSIDELRELLSQPSYRP